MAILNLEKKTILVVEDDDLSFLYLHQIFKLTKGCIIRARNGHEAIQLSRDHNEIDLILMDIQLPDIDGNMVTREIRKNNQHIPIIAQTASKTLSEKEIALEAGCSDVLVKPIKLADLMTMIGRFID